MVNLEVLVSLSSPSWPISGDARFVERRSDNSTRLSQKEAQSPEFRLGMLTSNKPRKIIRSE